MGMVVAGIIKNKPRIALFMDPLGTTCKTIAMSDSIDPTRVFVCEDNGKDGYSGVFYEFEKIDEAEEAHNKLVDKLTLFRQLFEKFANVPCPMCGSKLTLDGDMFVCGNPTPENLRSNKPCPFRAPLDYFSEDESEETTEST